MLRPSPPHTHTTPGHFFSIIHAFLDILTSYMSVSPPNREFWIRPGNTYHDVNLQRMLQLYFCIFSMNDLLLCSIEHSHLMH